MPVVAKPVRPSRLKEGSEIWGVPSKRDISTEDVAKKAYELFLARGGEHGKDQEDWILAENLLKSRN